MNCRALASAIVFASLAAPTAAETVAELDDAAARLQYAFFTEDVRALEDVIELIGSYQVQGRLAALRAYHLAYGYWKLAQVHASAGRDGRQARSSAAKAAQACSKHAKAAVGEDPRMAEAYAIEAACEGMPQGFMRLAGLGGSCSRAKALRTALSLRPENPRVKFVQALCHEGAQDSAQAAARWREVVAAFSDAPPATPGTPDWGHAEALSILGESHLQQRDSVAARDALERALVLAPDYKTAQRLLQAAASAH